MVSAQQSLATNPCQPEQSPSSRRRRGCTGPFGVAAEPAARLCHLILHTASVSTTPTTSRGVCLWPSDCVYTSRSSDSGPRTPLSARLLPPLAALQERGTVPSPPPCSHTRYIPRDWPSHPSGPWWAGLVPLQSVLHFTTRTHPPHRHTHHLSEPGRPPTFQSTTLIKLIPS